MGFLADHESRGDGEPIGGSISIHRPDWITDASWRAFAGDGWQQRPLCFQSRFHRGEFLTIAAPRACGRRARTRFTGDLQP